VRATQKTQQNNFSKLNASWTLKITQKEEELILFYLIFHFLDEIILSCKII
jgi:hypothetical protein